MTSSATLQPDPAPIVACTISRDVQNFELLINDMESELGESWGDLSFEDAVLFLEQLDARMLDFVALAVNGEDEGSLDRIAEVIRVCKAREIKVILIADQVSPVALHQLLRHGADDFVPYPLPQGALHDAIARVRKSAPPQMPLTPVTPIAPGLPHAPAFRARGDRDAVLLPVHGMAGGVGASTFACNLAWELANLARADGLRVCLIDLDFQHGAVSTYLDLPRRDAVYDILSDTENADSEGFLQAMLSFNDRLSVFTAPPDMLPLDIVSPEDIGRLLDMAHANFDFVVVDMPTTVVAWTETVLARAQAYFALIELDLRSAQNVLRLVRALKAEGLPYDKLRFILNRAPKFTDLTAKSRVKRMGESLDIEIEVQLPDGGVAVTQANDHGLPLAETAAKNPLRREVQKLAKSIYEHSKSLETARA